MKFSLRQRLILTNLILLFAVTLIVGMIMINELQRYYKSRLFTQLITQLDEIEHLLLTSNFGFEAQGINYAQLSSYARVGQMRLTLLDSIGTVLFESEIRPDSLQYIENHLLRPEVQMAIKAGLGRDERLSATVHQRLFYAAKKMTTPPTNTSASIRFIRLAIPLIEVERVLNEMRWKIFAGGVLVLGIAALINLWVSSRLTTPLRELARTAGLVKQGHIEAHFRRESDDELGELADLLNDMLAKLRNDWEKIQKLETMRSQFLGNVSHELRTPIFAVQGYLETLMENKVDNPQMQHNFIEKAYHQAGRLNNLLTDLIDISRIESREMKMSFRYFDLHEWLRKQVADLQSMAQENQVILTLFRSQFYRSVTVLGDRDRLNQVMTNLIVNAIKYNVPGGKVEVGYRDKKNNVEIFVADTGRGIPAEHLSRIFERFYRVDKERSRAVGGTGLGLAIVKHIVEAHDSQMMVQSEIGKGSIFSFMLKKE